MISVVQNRVSPIPKRARRTLDCSSLYSCPPAPSLSNTSSKRKRTTNTNYTQTSKYTQATFTDNILTPRQALSWALGDTKINSTLSLGHQGAPSLAGQHSLHLMTEEHSLHLMTEKLKEQR